MANKIVRADYMSGAHKAAMEGLHRTHKNCFTQTGVNRPGKTAHDKATGAWRSKLERRARHIARDPNAS